MVLDDLVDDEKLSNQSAIVHVEILPDLEQKISYTNYNNLLKKKINSLKEDILNYDMHDLFNSHKISKSFLDENSDKIEDYLYANQFLYDLLIEFNDINKEDLKKYR